MTADHLVAMLGVYAGTFVVGTISSVIPFVSIDVFLVGIVVAIGSVGAVPLVACASAGQLVGKLPIYFATRGVTSLSSRHTARVERVRAWVARWQRSRHLILGTSAVFGLPPFSIVATAAGALAIELQTFCVIVFAGRGLRFAAVVAGALALR